MNFPSLLIVLFLFISSSAEGAAPTGVRFRLMGGLSADRTTIGSKNDFIKDRSLYGIGASGVVGINLGPVILGTGADYTRFFQGTDKDDVDGTDISGSLVKFSAVAGLAFYKLCLIGKYHFKADYEVSQKTEDGDKESFSSPKGSFGISLLYRPGGRSYWSFDYQTVTFTEMKIGSTKYDLSSSSEKINLSSLGISYGFLF